MQREALVYFCGGGGGTLGLIRLCFKVLLAVDWDPAALRTHRKLVPGITVARHDLFQMTPGQVARMHGIDPWTFSGCILMSPPCQDFSQSGRRRGGRRATLLSRTVSAALEFPKATILVENVRGLALEGKWRTRSRFLEPLLDQLRQVGRTVPDLESACKDWVLDAADAGLPSHRHRLWIWVMPQGVPLPPVPAPQGRTTLEATILREDFNDPDPRFALLTDRECLQHFHPEHAFSRSYQEYIGQITNRMRAREPGFTITASIRPIVGHRVKHVHPTKSRLLTVGECMALMGWPLDMGRIPSSLTKAYEIVGNGIAPPQICAVVGAAPWA